MNNFRKKWWIGTAPTKEEMEERYAELEGREGETEGFLDRTRLDAHKGGLESRSGRRKELNFS